MGERAAPPESPSPDKAAQSNVAPEAQPGLATSGGGRAADKRRHATTKAEASPEVQALLDEARSFLDNADYDTALQEYEQVLKLDPGNSAAAEGKKKAINAKAYEEGLNR